MRIRHKFKNYNDTLNAAVLAKTWGEEEKTRGGMGKRRGGWGKGEGEWGKGEGDVETVEND